MLPNISNFPYFIYRHVHTLKSILFIYLKNKLEDSVICTVRKNTLGKIVHFECSNKAHIRALVLMFHSLIFQRTLNLLIFYKQKFHQILYMYLIKRLTYHICNAKSMNLT